MQSVCSLLLNTVFFRVKPWESSNNHCSAKNKCTLSTWHIRLCEIKLNQLILWTIWMNERHKNHQWKWQVQCHFKASLCSAMYFYLHFCWIINGFEHFYSYSKLNWYLQGYHMSCPCAAVKTFIKKYSRIFFDCKSLFLPYENTSKTFRRCPS